MADESKSRSHEAQLTKAEIENIRAVFRCFSDDSTAPSGGWECSKCGLIRYPGLRHDCPTAPMRATPSSYDCGGNPTKDYPGE